MIAEKGITGGEWGKKILSGTVSKNITEKVTLEQRLRVDERASCAEVCKGAAIVECLFLFLI